MLQNTNITVEFCSLLCCIGVRSPRGVIYSCSVMHNTGSTSGTVKSVVKSLPNTLATVTAEPQGVSLKMYRKDCVFDTALHLV